MGIDLGDILGFGKKVIKMGAPVLGSALLGPAGAGILEMVMGDNGVDSDIPNALQVLQDKLFVNGEAALKKYELDHQEQIATLDHNARITEAMVKSSIAQLEFDKVQIQVDDKFVSWQRPAIMYALCFCIVANVMSNIYGGLSVQGFTPTWLPTAFYTLFGTGFLGYSYLRTREKQKDTSNPLKSLGIGN
ncbi:unnamed protein product [marine sediment metagenome]|uniref:Holin of 3TMs, for gene-transfer release n=1 Tax=marine sediment metagenome TaxID=412755 RepID=X1AS44_9ZZZZ